MCELYWMPKQLATREIIQKLDRLSDEIPGFAPGFGLSTTWEIDTPTSFFSTVTMTHQRQSLDAESLQTVGFRRRWEGWKRNFLLLLVDPEVNSSATASGAGNGHPDQQRRILFIRDEQLRHVVRRHDSLELAFLRFPTKNADRNADHEQQCHTDERQHYVRHRTRHVHVDPLGVSNKVQDHRAMGVVTTVTLSRYHIAHNGVLEKEKETGGIGRLQRALHVQVVALRVVDVVFRPLRAVRGRSVHLGWPV